MILNNHFFFNLFLKTIIFHLIKLLIIIRPKNKNFQLFQPKQEKSLWFSSLSSRILKKTYSPGFQHFQLFQAKWTPCLDIQIMYFFYFISLLLLNIYACTFTKMSCLFHACTEKHISYLAEISANTSRQGHLSIPKAGGYGFH